MQVFKITALVVLFLGWNLLLYAQPATNNIAGVVLDKTTGEPLPGANIILLNHEPLLGTASNKNGEFVLQNVPVGRHSIKVTFLGYENKIEHELLVTSGQELRLTIELEAQTFEGEQVEVYAEIPKDEPINDLAFVSAKAFTVEETRRYAGGLDDPGRLVTAFAGVTSSGGTQSNAISIRGNAPKSVQWRLEGIEIPNPSHFAGLSVAGGGGLSLFSAQLLSNSDFMTGAFPAEYGNALSGVFDINFRTGNPDKYEHAIQLGINGLEASSGGPIVKGKEATYLFNYRFSTLTLLMPLLPTEGFIRYQDLSFNLDIPTHKAGRFNVWGIGGLDNQGLDAKQDSSQWEYAYWDFSNNDLTLGVGAVGISHRMLVNNKGYLKTTLAFSGNSTRYIEDQLDYQYNANPHLKINTSNNRLAFKSYLNQKLSTRLVLRSGIEYQQLMYDVDVNGRLDNTASIQNLAQERGHSGLTQLYTTVKADLSKRITVAGGLHGQWFTLNKEFLVEPRTSVVFRNSERSEFSLGYGLHSQIEELRVYFVQPENQFPNKNLKLAKAHHWVAGWDGYLNETHHVRVELFAQSLFDVPVIADSSFSMLNFLQDFTFNNTLTNQGAGKNYGVEFTLERFLNQGFYYLFTATVYKSKYKGGDGIWRNTRFDQNIALNALFGKEYLLQGGKKILGVNARFTVTGGERYSPVDELASTLQKQPVFDETQAFKHQFNTHYITDLSITYRINRAKYSSVWALQIKNALMAQDYSFDYNYQTQQVDLIKEGTILPVISWKVEF